jgi:hypothetical protein
VRFLLLALLLLNGFVAEGSAETIAPVRPGDILEMRLGGVPAEVSQDFNSRYTVSQEGSINVPLIGQMRSVGLTPPQLEKAVQTRLIAGKLFTNPAVSIILVQNNRFVSVGGGVGPPQRQLASAAPSAPIPAKAPGGRPRLALPDTENFTVADRPAFLFLPPAARRSQPQPWIFYAPTLPPYPDEAERWMHEQFLAVGIAVAGVDVGEAYGSPRSHAIFDALLRELTERRGFAAKPCLFGRSRGGLWVSSWAIANPARVAGLIGIYPVFDFRTYPKLEKAAPAYHLTPEEMAARAAEFNPIERIGVLAKAAVPALLIHGDADTVVPLRENSAEFVRR